MTLIFIIIALAAGVFMPVRWGVAGFLAASIALFTALVAINAASGFAGASIEESLLLFNGSYLSYFGFNLQISYRAFAGPIFAFALPLIYRLSLRRD